MPITVDTDLPLHDDRERSWDGDAARSAMARRCTTDDGVMADCMGRGFIWREPEENAATIGAYALPVADVFDGELHLVLSGVQAAANSISPAREPGEARALEASEDELDQMRSAVETILSRFAREFDDESIRAPWEDETESETSSARPTVPVLVGEPGPEAPVQTASGCCGGCGCGGEQTETSDDEAAEAAPTQKEEAAMPATSTQTVEAPRLRSRVLRASATGGDWRPPTDHFTNPHLTEPTKLTVTADGRVFGHLATWDQPHIGYDQKLVYPPRNASGAYEYFRQSTVVADSGAVVPVGVLTMNTGHADESLSADAASAHYDNTGTMIAAVNVGEDNIGIWLSGSVLPDVSPELRARFTLARVSGDWRQPAPGKPLELIAALSVPNPGFPVRQSPELLASDRLTLAASGLVKGDAGEISTFITAGAAVVDQAQQAALVEAVREAIAPDLIGQVRDAVVEALASRQDAATAPAPVSDAAPAAEAAPAAPVEVGGEESAPPAEGEPASTGEADPAATEPAVAATDADAAAASPAAEGEAAAIPDAAAAPAPAAPAAEAAPAAPVETAGQVAASALAARVRRQQARSAHARLLAAAGLAKKA